MSMSQMPAGPRYLKLRFDENEISVLRAACSAVAMLDHYRMMNEPADISLEDASRQAKKSGDSDMAEGLATMFKPDQEILIEREDLALVLDSLRSYGQSAPEEHAETVKNLIEKIERACQQG
jgi:hypothetical protein